LKTRANNTGERKVRRGGREKKRKKGKKKRRLYSCSAWKIAGRKERGKKKGEKKSGRTFLLWGRGEKRGTKKKTWAKTSPSSAIDLNPTPLGGEKGGEEKKKGGGKRGEEGKSAKEGR